MGKIKILIFIVFSGLFLSACDSSGTQEENYTLAVGRGSKMIPGDFVEIRGFPVFEDASLSLASSDSKLKWKN